MEKPGVIRDLSKAGIRRSMLAKRQALSIAEVEGQSRAIHQRLYRLDAFRRADSLWTYVSSKPGEVDTRALIESALARHQLVACPAVLPGGLLVWRIITQLTELVPGAYGIWEPPADSNPAPAATPSTVVLVPGLAFTSGRHRLGYGCGYFDRFLADFPGMSIGLCYDFQIIPALPIEPHDVALDYVVSESEVFATSDEF